MLRRLFIFFPLLFALFTTRASVEGIILSSGSQHQNSFQDQNNTDGFHSSIGIVSEFLNFFEADEEDDDEHFSGFLKPQRNWNLNLLSTEAGLSCYRHSLQPKNRLYLLFNSWKIDLL